MLKNYIKITLRVFYKYPTYTSINILELAIGIACSILIFLFIQNEFSYDRFHRNAKNIYRLESIDSLAQQVVENPLLQAAIAPTLKIDFPEVINTLRIWPKQHTLVSNGAQAFYEERVFYSDPSIFEMFDFPFLKKDIESIFQLKNSIVITKSIAKKYFNNEYPIGETLILDNTNVFKIAGILDDVPQNSHLKFNFLIPFSNVEQFFGKAVHEWNRMAAFYTYLQLHPDCQPIEFESKLTNFNKRYMGQPNTYYLKPLTSIHLYSHLPFELEPNGDIRYIYIFSTIAILILLISCFNFVNLSTAYSFIRAKEVGLRKVVGASRWQLIYQFLSETIFTSIIASFLSALMVYIFLPAFNKLAQKELSVDYPNIFMLLGMIGFVLAIGILAGSYPAFVLSAFHPLDTIKNKKVHGSRNEILRKGFVVFQFLVTFALFVSAFVIYDQMKYIHKKHLGFKKEQLLIIKLQDPLLKLKSEQLKQELQQIPDIVAVSGSRGIPGQRGIATWFRAENCEKATWIDAFGIDYSYVETYQMELLKGRNFSENHITDKESAFLINEVAMETFGWKEPINKKLEWFGSTGRVIGVIKNFHFKSLHEKIEPLILYFESEPTELSLRINTNDLKKTLNSCKKKFEQFSFNYPFDYFFLDQNFQKLYQTENTFSKMIKYFTVISTIIAVLGLYGLAAFSITQRTKEIGIRKTLGASIRDILLLITNDFLKIVLVSILLGTPIVYYWITRWLQNFAYKIEINFVPFLIGGTITIILAFISVSYHSVKAAFTNPIETIRNE